MKVSVAIAAAAAATLKAQRMCAGWYLNVITVTHAGGADNKLSCSDNPLCRWRSGIVSILLNGEGNCSSMARGNSVM